MKTRRIKLTTSALTLAAFTLVPVGLTGAERDANRSNIRTEARAQAAMNNGKLQLAPDDIEERSIKKIEGQKVRGVGGEDLGNIKDLLIEPRSGKVAFAVVAAGGLLGMGETLRLVPFASLQRTADNKGFSMSVTQDQWKEMPVVDRGDYDKGNFSVSAANQRQVRQQQSAGDVVSTPRASDVRPAPIYTDGSRQPDAVVTRDRDVRITDRADSSTNVQSGELEGVVRASTLRGKDIRAGDREVGEIETIVLDWQTGVASAVLDLDRDFTGTNRKFMVPVSQLTLRGEDQDVIISNLTRADFQPFAQRDGDSRLTPTGRTDNDRSVRRSGETDRTDARRTDVTTSDSRFTPMPQTNVSATVESAVRSARQNIANHPSLKTADVEVMAYNDQVLLRGFVDTEEMKDRVEDVAKQAAPGVKMVSHLLVRAPEARR
jgi:sporulation protein YlmC with PRC-barrel domain